MEWTDTFDDLVLNAVLYGVAVRTGSVHSLHVSIVCHSALAMVGIPDEFGYVVIVIGLSWFMNFFLVTLVIMARKKYGVEYPTLYADKDHKGAEVFP